VFFIGGTFTMDGGTISGNEALSDSKGGGVYMQSGTFTMNDGEISGNTSTTGSGGGVYVPNGGAFTMHGGTISGNTANDNLTVHGGGVYSNGTFDMYGGTISGNNGWCGGGVYVYSGTFTMNGGTISGNTALNSGGGVFVKTNGTFRIINGTIYGEDEGTVSLRNRSTINIGRALDNSGTATYGPSGTGTNLETTNNTIKMLNGVLQRGKREYK
jgi:hypothetical protein